MVMVMVMVMVSMPAWCARDLSGECAGVDTSGAFLGGVVGIGCVSVAKRWNRQIWIGCCLTADRWRWELGR
jgi:hypothetical protein